MHALETRSFRLKVEDGDELVSVPAAERTAVEKKWGDAVDRRNTAEKLVRDLFDRELKAVQVLVVQVGAAFPKPVLQVLIPGARSMGERRFESVVTPGQVHGALVLMHQGKRRVSIPDALLPNTRQCLGPWWGWRRQRRVRCGALCSPSYVRCYDI